ncbi:uncharacterized protein LOC131949005 [Physella acuta]|uniref:uncharacterized protein LOC131949005 n=1 Tax=Physella acuta TaxID=109671 RepID=UPI0027DD2962|nr:uncharacterized protein LOC131949005 [Physella acuta]
MVLPTPTDVLVSVLTCYLLSVAIAGQLSGVCQYGWFGQACQYKCHCQKDECHNGYCPLGCGKGWFGPQCQFADLLQTATDQYWATDRCPVDKLFENVSIRWNRTQTFSWLRLMFRFKVPDSIGDLQIVFNQTSNSATGCQDKKMSKVNDRTIDIYCDISIVDDIVVSGEGLEDLCRVYISGGRNLALRQMTSQISNYTSPVHTSVAANSVDGNLANSFFSNSCSHTMENTWNPWWRVEFPHPGVVTRVVVYNRDE